MGADSTEAGAAANANGVPRWAFERVDQQRAAHLGAQPNPRNVDVVMADPEGWAMWHAFAAYIARTEKPPA